MKVTACADGRLEPDAAVLAFDVSMDVVNLYTELGAESLELEFENRTDVIEQHLTDLDVRARRLFYKRILVVAEATGGYQESLMRVACRLGLEPAWVNGEAVAKMRVVESNDSINEHLIKLKKERYSVGITFLVTLILIICLVFNYTVV